MKKLTDIVTIDDFRARIPGIYEGLEISTFETYFTQLLDGDLKRVLPLSNPFWGLTTYTDTDASKLIREQLKVYLVYACYAAYIKQGSVTATETGPVKKSSDYGEQLTPTETAEFSVQWRSLALIALNELSVLVTPSNVNCATPTGYVGVKVNVVIGPGKSRFS